MENRYSDDYNDTLIEENYDTLFDKKPDLDNKPDAANSFFAKLLSILLHPLLMPTVGVWFITHHSTYRFLISDSVHLLIMGIVSVSTFLIPLLFVPWMLNKGIIESLQMRNHSERFFPLVLSFISILFTFFILRRINLPVSVYILRYVLAASVVVFFCILISTQWKISLHMAGIGGVCGALFSLSFISSTNYFYPLILMLLLSGLLGFARMKQKAHNSAQIYSGYLLGLFTVLLFFFV